LEASFDSGIGSVFRLPSNKAWQECTVVLLLWLANTSTVARFSAPLGVANKPRVASDSTLVAIQQFGRVAEKTEKVGKTSQHKQLEQHGDVAMTVGDDAKKGLV
jgi:hypothetical protein